MYTAPDINTVLRKKRSSVSVNVVFIESWQKKRRGREKREREM